MCRCCEGGAENAGLENAGLEVFQSCIVEVNGPMHRGGKCRTDEIQTLNSRYVQVCDTNTA